MALVLRDRVKETTTTTGTGTITLAGAVAGFQSFSVIGNANTTYYAIVGGTEFEVGIGTYTSSGTTLSRDTVLTSSNSGSKVDFSAGEKDVFCTQPADKAVFKNASGHIELPDDAEIKFGAGTDLVIKHTGGGSSSINNNSGTLQINQFANDSDVVINSDNGSGSTANYFRADGSTGDAILYHYGTEKLKTQSGGVDVTGNITVSGSVTFEGATADAHETTLAVTDPTADRTITLPNATGTVILNTNLNFPFFKADGSSDTIALTADNKLPFTKSDGSASNISLTT